MANPRNNWVYEIATGKWMVRFRDPSIYNRDRVNYAQVMLDSDPDPVYERFDSVNGRRPATAAEITESLAEQTTFIISQVWDTNPILQSSILAGMFPSGQLPNANQIANARARFIAIYTSLTS